MADSTRRDDAGYPLWGRILFALICFGISLGIGWALGGLMMAAIIGIGLAFFAFLAPGVLIGIFAVLEILGSCS